MGPYFAPQSSTLVSLVGVGVHPFLLPAVLPALKLTTSEVPGVVWSSTDFSGSFPSLPWSLSTGFAVIVRESCISARRFLLAPHPLTSSTSHLFPWVCLSLPRLPPPIALFSASYCLATTPNFQLTTPAPHLQQSFNFLWDLNSPCNFALTSLPLPGPSDLTILFPQLRVPGSTLCSLPSVYPWSLSVPSSIVLLWQTQVLVHFNSLPPHPALVTKCGSRKTAGLTLNSWLLTSSESSLQTGASGSSS